jgi:hypothetical protein
MKNLNLTITKETSIFDLDYILEPYILKNGYIHPALCVEFEDGIDREIVKEYARLRFAFTQK